MTTGTVHVVGAGLAGLSCATALAARGVPVRLYEATDHAGGRCRGWHDPLLDRVIDNGNHLILGANPECFAFLDRIGGRDGLIHIDPVRLAFHDLADGATWSLRPGRGHLPLWLLDADRRVPGSLVRDYLRPLRLALAGPDTLVSDILPGPDDLLTRRLWQPLAVSILNTPYQAGSAQLLWSVLSRTLLRGAEACRPFIAGSGGLSAALVDPALDYLERHGVVTAFGQRLLSLNRQADGRVTGLVFNTGRLGIGPDDRVVLALPAEALPALLPDLTVPDRFHPILNAHFRLPTVPALPGGLPMLGLVGGVAEWLFVRGDVVSVTISAADTLIARPADDLAALIWRDVATVLTLDPEACPPYRIIKERRASFAATPTQEKRRPDTRAAGGNLLLAGDWTDTGLPATIEGAIQSGHRAARMIV